MDQDTTWHGGMPQPRRHCVRWGPSPLPQKGTARNFGPCLFWPNGWMDQDASWYGGRPLPRRHCVRWGPSPPPQKGRSPQFLADVYCGQTAGWMKTPLGTEVDLGPGHIVLDGSQLCAKRVQQPLIFSARVYCGHGRPSQLLLSSCLLFKPKIYSCFFVVTQTE